MTILADRSPGRSSGLDRSNANKHSPARSLQHCDDARGQEFCRAQESHCDDDPKIKEQCSLTCGVCKSTFCLKDEHFEIASMAQIETCKHAGKYIDACKEAAEQIKHCFLETVGKKMCDDARKKVSPVAVQQKLMKDYVDPLAECLKKETVPSAPEAKKTVGLEAEKATKILFIKFVDMVYYQYSR